ncbi:testis-expressed protein 10 homolog [Copidosoma floridanum]|uniref:testis-expressed protein 10 homolog n=1 Tax=Copidosoma floridanum TaxID=29053 RepID=UPI0006C98797|nr:testis-expressed protein 10 homolog [Copidosoma floridanum]
MGKNHKHQKMLKSEKAKVKLKGKQQQPLPKGLNITNTSFKAKKIIIRTQLKQQDASEILSRRKLNVKDLLSRLQHHNSSSRQDAVRELKEILAEHAADVLNVHLSALLKGIAALALDKEKPVRREALKALSLILAAVSNDQLRPFSDVLISYLKCAMTHIDPHIMEDSLLFLDIIIQHSHSFLINNSGKLLTYFLDMISKLRSQAQPGRQLSANLNFKNSSMKWRSKVLNSLQEFMLATIKIQKNSRISSLAHSPKVYHVRDKNGHCPIYSLNRLRVCPVNFENSGTRGKINKSLDLDALKNYIDSLIPLMFDSWLEVCPKKQPNTNHKIPISDEASSLLRSITSIMHSIIEYLELLESDSGTLHGTLWFKSKFKSVFIKNLLLDFPYQQLKSGVRVKKSEEELAINPSNDCMEQNLTLCYIYIWFTAASSNTKLDSIDRSLCSQILQFLIDILDNWKNTQTPMIPCLISVLRVLFLEACITWYKNKVPLSDLLKSVINVYLSNKKDLQKQLFSVMKDIVMNHNLIDLHSEESFKDFIKSLPKLLLKSHIFDSTIQMLNRVVLQYKQWIEKELRDNHEAIIENAKLIQIIGSENEHNSRLMICNLFYFMDEQVYF